MIVIPRKKDSLMAKNPNLCKEWDYKKNHPLRPMDVFPNTHKSVFWKCSCGNSWEAQIQRRNSGYCKCKRCNKVNYSSRPKNAKEFKDNCLLIKNRKLSQEWNYEKNYPLAPQDILCRGKKEYWWKCKKCGYEWESRIDHRHRGYGKCVRCNSLATKKPDLLKEWDYINNKGIDPYLINYHAIRVVQWVCNKGHMWKSSVDNRTRKSFTPGCPYCSNPPKRVCIDNCLATIDPLLAKEWHPTKNGKLTPYDVTASCNRKAWWMCKDGHEWEAKINNRKNGNGCPFCHGVNLKDGTYCDSIPEAYMYLEYKRKNIEFLHNKKYGGKLGERRYDFYFSEDNKYVEITSYPKTNKNPTSFLNRIIKQYYSNIRYKKNYVEKVLKAKFEFIYFVPTKKQIEFVRRNSK